MTFFNAAGLFLAGHFPPMYVIIVLSAILAVGLVISVPVEPETGGDLR
jgi:hypothetical protein